MRVGEGVEAVLQVELSRFPWCGAVGDAVLSATRAESVRAELKRMLRYAALLVARRIVIAAAACGALAGGTGGCSGERPGPPATTVALAPSPPVLHPLPPLDRSVLLAAAPELTAESAAHLERSAPGASIEVLARASLLEASRGFARLSSEDLRALGAVFERAYAGLAPAERERLEAYLQGLRAGRLADDAAERTARQTFNRAISGLGSTDREVLQSLYARAIGQSLAAAETAKLPPLPTVARVATNVPEPSAAPTLAPGFRLQPGGGVGIPYPEARPPAESVDAETLGRERAEGHRNAIRAAEDRVKAAEAKLKWAEEHWHFVNSHTNQTLPLTEARHTLESARKNHAAAKEYLDAVEERARKAGIPPGWLR
ncbi:MAG: hypothetical protein ABW221_14300 [Vicinamibacteria bacterium]